MHGLSWSAANQFVQQTLRFAISAVLARILSPVEFGLVAMLTVFTGFARLFADLGFGASIVQRKDLRPEHLDTVFWINIVAGVCLTFILFACAPALAAFYKEPQLLNLTRLVSLNFAVNSLNVVQAAFLQRTMDFRRLFINESLALLLSGICGIVLALKGFGVYSLIFQSLIASVVSVCTMWVLSPWKPGFKFEANAVKELFGFSGNLFISNAINYWARNFDPLAIGKFIGSSAAGLYNRAFQLMLLPVTQITGVVTRVMFPALSEIQDDREKVRSVYLRSTRTIAFLAFPMMLFLMVLARPSILSIYGPKWIESVPVFQILCLASISQSIGFTLGWLYMSQGRTDIQRNMGVFITTMRILGFFVGVRWGIVGVAISYVLMGYVVIWYPSWAAAGRLVGLSFRTMTTNLAPSFFCAIAATLPVWLMESLLEHRFPPSARLILGLGLGVTGYLFLVSHFSIQAWLDFSNLLLREDNRAIQRLRLILRPILKRLPLFYLERRA